MSVNVDGFGSVTWWGFSPALNLISLYEQGRRFELEIIIVYLNNLLRTGRSKTCEAGCKIQSGTRAYAVTFNIFWLLIVS